MRKHLIGTILVLAALAACNKEIETSAPVVDNGQEETTPGKVTLTFTATISEETRTAYDDQLKGSWVLGDKITVCVFNNNPDNPDYNTAEFEATSVTDTGMEFTGVVEDGYTTIVSGVYPADSQHVFEDGVVKSVYLSEEYNLFDVDDEGNHVSTFNDEGIALPMVGQMVDGTFTFHHICGALKITVIDIFNALTFTTASEPITGLFKLDGNGRITMENAAITCSNAVTFNYDRLYLGENPDVGARDKSYRTFYIPIPDGTISGGATMAIKNGNKVVFEKTTSNNNRIVFDSNVIKRLQALQFTPRNDWSISPDFSGENAVIYFNVQNSDDKYLRISTTKANFENKYHGSLAEFIEERLHGSYQTLTGSSHYDFDSSIGEYFDAGPEKVFIMCGVTSTTTNRKFTFDYCLVEDTVLDPATPEYLAWLGDWQVTEDTETNPKTDTWTITRGATNSTYAITGLVGKTSIEAQGVYSSSDHSLSLRSQEEIGTLDGNTVSLLRRSNTTGSIVSSTSGNYFGLTIAKLLLNDGTVTISDTNYGYGLYWKNDNDKWTSYSSGSLKRIKFKPIERVTETE